MKFSHNQRQGDIQVLKHLAFRINLVSIVWIGVVSTSAKLHQSVVDDTDDLHLDLTVSMRYVTGCTQISHIFFGSHTSPVMSQNWY